MKLPDNQLISEILQRVSNAKTKEEKIQVLRHYESPALKAILIWNFDPSVRSCLPDGEVPYKKNDAPIGTEHTKLQHEYRILYNFIVGGNADISQTKKETLFIQLIEGLHETESEVLCLVKDKQLGKKYKITHNVVKEAFPSIQWGNRG